MQRPSIVFLSCILLAASSLNAQEVDLKISDAKAEAKIQTPDLEDVLESPSDVKTPAEPVAPVEPEADEPVEDEAVEDEAVESDEAEGTVEAADATDEDAEDATADTSDAIDSEGETVDLDGEEEDEEEEDGPVFVSLNEEGQLVGQATATVSGDIVPIEANVSLVRDGVLLSKIVANEDGSFAFPNIAPGDYNMYGSASSYCGQQPFTVMSSGNACNTCCESLSLELSQGGSCYSGMSGAPASSFSAGGAGGGFGGGGFFGGGGGFAAGGGGGLASSGLRLLRIGGIATAIAVGVSGGDDASPSE